MAYVNQHSGQRTPILVATVAIQAGLLYAVVNAFGGGFTPVFHDRHLRGEQIPLPKVPTTHVPKNPVQPSDHQRQANPATGDERQALDDPFKGVDVTDFPLGGGIPLDPGGNGGPLTQPTPQPQPLFTPKAARPLSSPGSWVTTDDYPSRDLREGREGATRFRLSIGSDGLVKDCTVVASSGSPTLDDATCTKLRQRGRFAAATDANGAATAGSYSGTVRWKLPLD